MDDVWAMLFLVGLAVLPLVTLGSIGVVVFLAVRIAAHQPRPSGVWTMVALHLVLVAGLGVALELAGAWFSTFVPWAWLAAGTRVASVLIVPLVLYRRFLRITRQGEDVGNRPTVVSEAQTHRGASEVAAVSPGRTDLAPDQRRTAIRIAWIIGVTGALAPWLVGLGVKAYLDSVGRPTLPVTSFLDPLALPVLLLTTLSLWSFPFLLLALLARFWILARERTVTSFRGRLWLVWLTYAAGMAVALPAFVPVFWEFDILYLFLPVGVFVCPFMALGYGAGLLLIHRGWIRS